MTERDDQQPSAEVAELQAELAAQRLVLERLERAVASLGGSAVPPSGASAGEVAEATEATGVTEAEASPDESEPRAEPARPGRRTLFQHAAAAAVVGGAVAVFGDADPAAAAPGLFDGSPAVVATASPNTANGVYATTASGHGVLGVAASGTGVRGEATTGVGVAGVSTSNSGVLAATTAGTAVVVNTGIGGTHLRFEGTPAEPPSSGVARVAGSMVRDSSGALWFCLTGGTPGVWRKLTGPGTAGALHLLSAPKRVYDTRAAFPPAVGIKAPLPGGGSRPVDLTANSSGVPTSAIAVVVSLTVTNTTGGAGGFLAVYRDGISWPGTSNLNWSGPGQNIAVTTITAVDVGKCSLYASNTTDVIVDVLGYYR